MDSKYSKYSSEEQNIFSIMVKNTIKAEMKRVGVSSDEMVILLKDVGENLNKTSFLSKLSRGKFSAVFFIKCLVVLGVDIVKIQKIEIDKGSKGSECEQFSE